MSSIVVCMVRYGSRSRVDGAACGATTDVGRSCGAVADVCESDALSGLGSHLAGGTSLASEAVCVTVSGCPAQIEIRRARYTVGVACALCGVWSLDWCTVPCVCRVRRK